MKEYPDEEKFWLFTKEWRNTFPEEISDRSDEDDGMRVTRWN